MKIGINASFARRENTGIGQVTLNFLKHLSKVSKEVFGTSNVEFVVYLEEDIDLKLPPNFEKDVFLPMWKRDDLIRKVWWEKFILPKKATEDGCEVFISLYQSASIFTEKIHHVMVVHDVIPELFPQYLNNSRKKLYYNLAKKAIRKADRVVAISKRTEKDLIKYIDMDPAKISVAYLDVDDIYKKDVSLQKTREVMDKYGLKSGYIYGGGGMEVRKNIHGLIHAYKILYERNKKNPFIDNFPKLVISGKLMPQLAPLVTDAEDLLKKLNLTQQVKLLDFVPQEDLPALYKEALVFVYPSSYEGFGLPILEAMNVGTPVITSKTSSLPEVGRDAVLYTDTKTVDDMAMVIRNVLLNKDIRDELRKRGKDRASNFSYRDFIEKILNIISGM